MELSLARLDGRLLEGDLRLRLAVEALIVVDDRLGDDAALLQAAVTLQGRLHVRKVRAFLGELGLGHREVRRHLVHDHLKGTRIDLGAELPGLHGRVVVAVQALDATGDVGADHDHRHRIHGAGRCHRHRDRTASHRRRDVPGGRFLPGPPIGGGPDKRQEGDRAADPAAPPSWAPAPARGWRQSAAGVDVGRGPVLAPLRRGEVRHLLEIHGLPPYTLTIRPRALSSAWSPSSSIPSAHSRARGAWLTASRFAPCRHSRAV